MSGLDAVIARVDDIESRIVSLDAAARAARAAEAAPAAGSSETAGASAATFAEALEAAKGAAPATSASTTIGTIQESAADLGSVTKAATGAEVIAALQTLFAGSTAAGTSTPTVPGGTGVDATLPSLQEIAGLLR